MSKPVVAIIGRPNVGKSSFFNALIGERVSIVDDMPGVTRDRIYATATWREREFLMIDTGGIEPVTDDILLKSMREQAEIAMETADVILFICDIKSGLTASDHDIAIMLRKSKKPVVVCVNKVDKIGTLPAELYEFYNLGLGDISRFPRPTVGIGELRMRFKTFPEFPRGH
jgi:GTP-binding protein